ncbi:MAG: anti-sigma factor domain-containing protein [Sphingomonas sp.]
MTGDTTPAGPEQDVTAAELALGLLEGDERAAALRRVLADSGFAQEVERWRVQFGVLFNQVPAIAAPADGLARLEAAIAAPANDTGPARLRLWQGIAGTATLIAAGLLLVVALRPGSIAPGPASTPRVAAQANPQARPTPVLVAQLAPVGGAATIFAVCDPAAGAVRIAAARLTDANHSAELWVIPKDGVAHSLGLLNSAGSTDIPVKTGNRTHLTPGSTLAVTIEQPGGSPNGKPNGAVVASGALILI